MAQATIAANGENTHPEGKKAGARKRVADRRQKLADLENAKAADDARVAATNAILQLGDREQAVSVGNAAAAAVRRMRTRSMFAHYASDAESDADEAVGIDGQPEDEGDDPDDDELAQEELADEARAERAAEGLGEAEAIEEDA